MTRCPPRWPTLRSRSRTLPARPGAAPGSTVNFGVFQVPNVQPVLITVGSLDGRLPFAFTLKWNAGNSEGPVMIASATGGTRVALVCGSFSLEANNLSTTEHNLFVAWDLNDTGIQTRNQLTFEYQTQGSNTIPIPAFAESFRFDVAPSVATADVTVRTGNAYEIARYDASQGREWIPCAGAEDLVFARTGGATAGGRLIFDLSI